MSEIIKPRIVNLKCEKGKKLGVVKVFSFDMSNKESIECGDVIQFIELEPALQLMKEMGEALKENGLSHDFDCGISVNGRHECSCGYLKSKEVLEKYRKFLEWIK